MINYLKQNPKKLIVIFFVMLVGIAANIFVNINFTSIALSFFVGLFTSLVTGLILLQSWGEYKNIEGFIPTIKEFFKW